MRFAISPLAEVFASVVALDEPGTAGLHLPWISASRKLIDDADLALLLAFRPKGVNAPDFVCPSPASPLAQIEDELQAVLATPADQIRAEIHTAYGRVGLPEVLRPFIQTPDAALEHLADTIRRYWHRVLAPHWQRMRALLEADVLYRARQITDGGVQRSFSDIHDQVRFVGDTVTIDKPADLARDLDGQGLLLVPSVFIWPRLGAIVEGPWQPALVYPARGIGMLWERGQTAVSTALGALLGKRRALVLADLDAPRSTSEIARRLDLSPPSVSQHLSVLHGAGLVRSSRLGHAVLYTRTARGDELVMGCT